MLQLQPPRFLPLPRRRGAPPPALAFHSQWKLPDVDTDSVQERVRSWASWLSRARNAIVYAARERGGGAVRDTRRRPREGRFSGMRCCRSRRSSRCRRSPWTGGSVVAGSRWTPWSPSNSSPGLKEQGRLGRSFGKVTIRDQPPSNTIQKIVALKEAMASVENYLQHLNVSLLKMRTIFLAGQPEVTTQVALVLLASSAVHLMVPFKYVLAFFTLDLITRELEFRREMAAAFMNFMKERWESIHAAPVVVLPYDTRVAKAATKHSLQNLRGKQNLKICSVVTPM